MRRKTEKRNVTFEIVTEDPNTGEETGRYKYETSAPEGDDDYLNRVAQAVEGTLFAHAENPIYL